MKQRVVLWAAAAMLLTTAAVLVVVAGGDGDDGPPPLPLGGEPDAAAPAEAAEALDIAPAPAVVYVPDEGLPPLGGEAPAYRTHAAVTEEQVRHLAEAFDILSEPFQLTDQGGAWHAEDGRYALDVHGPDGGWSAYRMQGAEGGGSPPDTGASVGTAGPTEPAGDPVPSTGVCPIDPAPVANVGDVRVECELSRPERPSDLPTEAEARQYAAERLRAAGAPIADATVQVEDGITQWWVSFEPVVEGRPAPGLSMSVSIGVGGRVDSASGYIGLPEKLGDYPLVDTAAAIARVNESWENGAVPLPEDDANSPMTVIAPTSSTLPPTPSEVRITAAEIVLMVMPSWDDSGTYLVPGYRFVADDGSNPVISAVADHLLTSPP